MLQYNISKVEVLVQPRRRSPIRVDRLMDLGDNTEKGRVRAQVDVILMIAP